MPEAVLGAQSEPRGRPHLEPARRDLSLSSCVNLFTLGGGGQQCIPLVTWGATGAQRRGMKVRMRLAFLLYGSRTLLEAVGSPVSSSKAGLKLEEPEWGPPGGAHSHGSHLAGLHRGRSLVQCPGSVTQRDALGNLMEAVGAGPVPGAEASARGDLQGVVTLRPVTAACSLHARAAWERWVCRCAQGCRSVCRGWWPWGHPETSMWKRWEQT